MKIIRSKRKTISLSLDKEGELLVRAPILCPQAVIDGFIEKNRAWIAKKQAEFKPQEEKSAEEIKALRASAKAYLPARVAHFAPLVGAEPKGLTITAARTRFGSCSSKGRISFSLFLMEKGPAAIDYVVVHELCHLKQMNHSKAFYREVERILPDYKERIKELKK